MKNIALVKYPFVKNIERCGPRVPNAYSKCNAFWTQVFKACDEFHNKIKLTNAIEVLSEPICFSQRIRVGNAFLIHKQWIDKGVYCVAHFLNEVGKILSHVDFQRRFCITIDFVTYSRCKLAIKTFLRNNRFEFCNNNVINLTACLQKLYETNKGCKLYYDILNQSDAKPNCCSKWEDKLQRNIPWQACFHQLSKIHDVNIKWFEMRIMHRIIAKDTTTHILGM